VSAEGSAASTTGMTRMSSPMAAATAISPHPFLPSNNNAPPHASKQEQIPLTQTDEEEADVKRRDIIIK